MLAKTAQLASHMQSAVDATSGQQALDIASAIVASRCGQQFLPGTSTVALPTPAGPWLSLPQRPLDGTAAIAVVIDGVAVTDWTRVGDRLFRYGGWRARWDTAPVVTVTYSHGGPVPTVVLGAVLAVAADIYENPSGLSSETVDDYTWRRSETDRGSEASLALSEAVRAYRRRPLTVAIR